MGFTWSRHGILLLILFSHGNLIPELFKPNCDSLILPLITEKDTLVSSWLYSNPDRGQAAPLAANSFWIQISFSTWQYDDSIIR